MVLSMLGDDLKTLSSLMGTKTVESDMDLAYNLQLQEALVASSGSSSTPPIPYPDGGSSSSASSDVTDFMMWEIERYEQEMRDMELCKLEMQNLKQNLSMQLHDKKVASEIMRIPDHDWKNLGGEFGKPFSGTSSSSSLLSSDQLIGMECFRMYFKGIVADDNDLNDVKGKGSKKKLGAIGVAICDEKDYLLFELSKPLVDGEDMSGERAEFEALVAGLETAKALELRRVEYFCDSFMFYQYVSLFLRQLLALELRRVEYFCDSFMFYQYVNGGRLPTTHSVANLMARVNLLHNDFARCIPRLVAQSDIKFAFELARASLTSQLIKSADNTSRKETCSICFEDRIAKVMFSIDGCGHRYCSLCMVQHLEAKLLDGGLPKCPFQGCKSGININRCRKLLPPRLLDIMSQRLKEATIPASKKIYCPISTCSTLMSKSEVKEYRKTSVRKKEHGASRCIKCHGFFCAHCKVPCHSNMTCKDYQRMKRNSDSADKKLISLAAKKRWAECRQCKNMIELAEGCYHITCRCGHEFCYICGAAWKNKKATCRCRLWDEWNIIRNRNGRRN